MNQKLFIPYPKIVLSVALILLVHLCITYLSLSYVKHEDKTIQLLPVRKGTLMEINPAPIGNIFSEDRVIDISQKNSDTEKNRPSVDKFRLVSIIRQGNTLKAIFISETERVLLGEGESQPSLGTIEGIAGNEVTTKNAAGVIQHWQLFPTVDEHADSQDQQESQIK